MSVQNDMLEMFLFEMQSLLEQLDEILLSCEKNQVLADEDVAEIFRIMHTIKGSSAMMEYDLISTVTHKLEDTFAYIRDNGIQEQFFTSLFDLMLDATEFLKSQLEAIQQGEELATGNDELIGRTLSFLAALKGEGSAAVPAATVSAAQPAAEASPVEDAVSAQPAEASNAPVPADPEPIEEVDLIDGELYRVQVMFEEDCGMENIRAFMLLNTLRPHGAVISMDPPDIEDNTDTAATIRQRGFELIMSSELDQGKLQSIAENAIQVRSAIVSVLDKLPETSHQQAGPTPGQPICYQAHVAFEDECGMENLRAFMLLNSLRAKGCEILEYTPADIEENPASSSDIIENGFIFSVRTVIMMSDLQDLVRGAMYVKNAVVTTAPDSSAPAAPALVAAPQSAAQPSQAAPAAPAAKPAQAPKQATAPAANAHKPIKQNLINVSLQKLDELMDLMGELVITEAMVTHSPDLQEISKLDNFNKSARQLRKLTDELQDMVMSIRMVPVAGTFQRMQRIVRDMCRALDKEADLVTMGDETDIDKTIIDAIADPIMHIVRNSMDHGIETPDEREAAGKPRGGTITLSAQNTGGEILITVSDDGKGLDAQGLLEKAKNKGILTKPAEEYTDKEAYLLLCAPGFSTKEQATEFSGRGVGMDVVKKNIEKIGGSVVIESKKGYGMTVFLKIPLTLAIVDGMEISVGDNIYTLQITSINESFKATNEQVITDTDGNEMILIRGSVYPIIRLHELYDIPDAVTDIEEGILMWVESGDRSVCLFADQLIGEQQIVVKPLPRYLAKYEVKSVGISGCTILGDGMISLILDAGSIIEKVMEKR